VGQFRCPRHNFGRGHVRGIELHVFVDASQSAFAAVANWRVTYENDDVLVSLVCQNKVRSDANYVKSTARTAGSSYWDLIDGHCQAGTQRGHQ